MSNTLKLGNGKWATGKDTLLSFSDTNNNYKPLPFSFSRDSSGTVVNKDGLIETVGSGEPRIDFKDNTKGSLLLEPQRSNLITYSEDFSQWTKLNGGTGSLPIVTSNNTISPDGTQNADKIVLNKGNATSNSDYSLIRLDYGGSDVDGTASVYLKSDVNVDVEISSDDISYQTISVTTNWKRFEVSDATSDRLSIGLRGTEPSTSNATVYAWGAQLEDGSYSTSYIPTSGSAVTRVADVCNNGGNDQVINSTEGVLYIEADILKTSGTGFLVSISDGLSLSQSINIRQQSSGTLSFQVSSGSSNTFVNTTDWSEGVNKIALRYNSTGINVYINGNSKGTNSAITYPNINNLDIASRPDQIGQLIELLKVKDVRVYNTSLTDQELIALTKI